jgi:predicted aspartyl protease
MLCRGEWMRCDDGVVRPMVNAEILAADGNWRSAKFLLDTGADRTVLRAGVLDDLHLPHVRNVSGLGGAGGAAESVEIATQIRLTRDDGQWATFRGTYAAFLRDNALDVNVLGRDILNMFAVIVDHGADRVVLVRGEDTYAIQRRQ